MSPPNAGVLLRAVVPICRNQPVSRSAPRRTTLLCALGRSNETLDSRRKMPAERLTQFADASIRHRTIAEKLRGRRGSLRFQRTPLTGRRMRRVLRQCGDRETEKPILSVPRESNAFVSPAVLDVRAAKRVWIVALTRDTEARRLENLLDRAARLPKFTAR